MKPSFARSIGLLLAAAWVGCSSPAPSGGTSSGTDGGPAKIGDADERCSSGAYGDEKCDQCQNEHCCNERFACYDDKDCYSADWKLDACLGGGGYGDAGDSGGWDSGSPSPVECWKRFVDEGGNAAATINQCILDHCKSDCER